jgi:hypothetical protein
MQGLRAPLRPWLNTPLAVIARSPCDEAIQGPRAVAPGLLRCARNDGRVDAAIIGRLLRGDAPKELLLLDRPSQHVSSPRKRGRMHALESQMPVSGRAEPRTARLDARTQHAVGHSLSRRNMPLDTR